MFIYFIIYLESKVPKIPTIIFILIFNLSVQFLFKMVTLLHFLFFFLKTSYNEAAWFAPTATWTDNTFSNSQPVPCKYFISILSSMLEIIIFQFA